MHFKSYMFVGPLSPGADSKDYVARRAKTEEEKKSTLFPFWRPQN